MTAFRVVIAAIWIALSVFTAAVIWRDGMGLLPIFFGAIREGHWPGQFNADFLTLLFLSGLWTAWRGGFAIGSIALGIFAFFMGGGFLLPYLFWLTRSHADDLAIVLLGVHHRGN